MRKRDDRGKEGANGASLPERCGGCRAHIGPVLFLQADPQSPWHSATFVYSGTPADLRDLKRVVRSDNPRVQILVVLAVVGVLLVIFRRPMACLYMIATVVFSYYVTMGVTYWVFALSFGVLLDTFVVRTVLLPAFLALLCRRQEKRLRSQPPGPPSPHRKPVSPSVTEAVQK